MDLDLVAVLNEGIQRDREGDVEGAGECFQTVIAQDPSCAQGWFYLGVLGMKIGDWMSAATMLEHAVKLGLADVACRINLGECYRRLGCLSEAQQLLMSVTTEDPESVDARVNLAVVLNEQKLYTPALSAIEEALALRPDFVPALFIKGELARKLEKPEEAVLAYEKVIELAPQHHEAWLCLGEATRLAGDLKRAIDCYEQVLRANPRSVAALTGLGAVALEQRGDAELWYRQALEVDPGSWEALFGLGVLNFLRGNYVEAEGLFRRCVETNQTLDEGWLKLGDTLYVQGRYAEAREAFEAGLERNPYSIGCMLGAGNTFMGEERVGKALRYYRSLLRHLPGDTRVVANMALAYHDLGKLAQAQSLGEQAMAAAADDHERNIAKHNLAQVLLRRGRLTPGWNYYETEISFDMTKRLPFPAWEGASLEGKRLLIWQDQGIGDVILFGTMFGEVIKRAKSVVVECEKKLIPLIRRSFPEATIVPRTSGGLCANRLSREGVDLHCAMSALPKLLRPNWQVFPRPSRRLLTKDEARSRYWRQRLDALGPEIKVGICWRSKLTSGRRYLYYSDIGDWGSVFNLPGVKLINLQYDQCEEELALAANKFGVEAIHFKEIDHFDDIDEVASLISQLDVVVTAPTSVAMVAAGLGVPTLVGNTFADWVCLGRRRDPWFRSMQYFQRRWNQRWPEIIEQMAKEVEHRFGLSQG